MECYFFIICMFHEIEITFFFLPWPCSRKCLKRSGVIDQAFVCSKFKLVQSLTSDFDRSNDRSLEVHSPLLHRFPSLSNSTAMTCFVAFALYFHNLCRLRQNNISFLRCTQFDFNNGDNLS